MPSMKGKTLRILRKRLGLTQRRLAERLGVTGNYVAMAERGEKGIAEPLARLVKVLAATHGCGPRCGCGCHEALGEGPKGGRK